MNSKVSRKIIINRLERKHADACKMMGVSDEVKAGLADHLGRLWRYGLVLSGRRDIADDLVRRTCVRVLIDSSEFVSGSRLDRWLISILRSIWLNEVRSLTNQENDSASMVEKAAETDTPSHPVLRNILNLESAQRETLFLVYVEGLTYRQVAAMLEVPSETIVGRLVMARERLVTRAADLATQPSMEAKGE